MKTIEVVFVTKGGTVLADAEVKDHVEWILSEGAPRNPYCEISSVVLLNEFRIAHASRKANVKVYFKGKDLGLSLNGRLKEWPEELRVWDRQLCTLLGGHYED